MTKGNAKKTKGMYRIRKRKLQIVRQSYTAMTKYSNIATSNKAPRSTLCEKLEAQALETELSERNDIMTSDLVIKKRQATNKVYHVCVSDKLPTTRGSIDCLYISSRTKNIIYLHTHK